MTFGGYANIIKLTENEANLRESAITEGKMHEGHRQRMYERLINGDDLFSHELLEILLFSALPRVNTNHIAHALIDTFGTLSGVLSADVDSLMTVPGVGKSTALYLKSVGEVMRRVDENNSGCAVFTNYRDIIEFVKIRMRRKNAEILEVYLLDRANRVKSIHPFTNYDRDKVDIDPREITALIAKNSPHSIAVAHNHMTKSAEPSARDDKFTAQMQMICSLNNVCLFDHVIYCQTDECFSYFSSRRLEEIQKKYNFAGLFKGEIIP